MWTTECSREDIGQLIWKMDFKFGAASPTWRTLLEVGRVVRTLMMLRCNWSSSSQTCELGPAQFGWIFFSLPIGLDHRRVDCLLVSEMANMKNSQHEHA